MTWTYPALQKRFQDILIKHGQAAYLRRRCTDCSQDAPFAHYDDDCETCGGTGYKQTLERYTMRKQIVGAENAYPTSMLVTNTGPKLDEGIYFFCEGSVNPKNGDLVYDWNNATDEYDIYELSKVLERRYDDRVLFYTCAGELRVNLKS